MLSQLTDQSELAVVPGATHLFEERGALERVTQPAGNPAPTDEALQAVLHKIITRTMKLLTRQGVLV